MTQKNYFLMFNTNRYNSVQARDEVTNKNQLSSDNSRRVFNIVEYFLKYNQVPSCNSNNIFQIIPRLFFVQWYFPFFSIKIQNIKTVMFFKFFRLKFKRYDNYYFSKKRIGCDKKAIFFQPLLTPSY
ncbi:hypothetical protein EDEG_00511 [Edhazardia aedis USNM 41457]|uniref:Uncharacterized protein n=1 Tax=Edhazardia aedis (strain USNM 41457) TaxID=1003232 RepID=J9D138_EDHAE|nr:hypothetical protein EDEG_00511 [Edhazardia aedis USNM 41457]|eukprot:EJW01294.1 hypothetical protein EDEG_00511 [Edhazardia aedis USNM 41457]